MPQLHNISPVIVTEHIFVTSPLVAVTMGDGDRPVVGDVVLGFLTLDCLRAVIMTAAAAVDGLFCSQILVLFSTMASTTPVSTGHHHDIPLAPVAPHKLLTPDHKNAPIHKTMLYSTGLFPVLWVSITLAKLTLVSNSKKPQKENLKCETGRKVIRQENETPQLKS